MYDADILFYIDILNYSKHNMYVYYMLLISYTYNNIIKK